MVTLAGSFSIIGIFEPVPRLPIFCRHGFGRRPDGEGQEDDQLIVRVPIVRQETGFGLPTVTYKLTSVHHPLPIYSLVEFLRHPGDVGTFEVLAGQEGPRQDEGRIDGRGLGTPDAPPAFGVQEMVKKTVLMLGAITECLKGAADLLVGLGIRDPSAGFRNGEAGKRKTGCRYRSGRAGPRRVLSQAGGTVGAKDEVLDRVSLDLFQEKSVLFGERRRCSPGEGGKGNRDQKEKRGKNFKRHYWF